MAVTFFPFNSIVVDGVPDRPANAENLAAYLAGFFSNGVIMQEDTALKVEAYSGMEVHIYAGVGNINGKTIINDATEIVTLATANASLDRIDRVVFRLDEVNRLMEFDVLTGAPASDPVAPELTQGADVYELCLAEIRVPAGASEILASHIKDNRADVELCGAANIPKHIHNTAEDRQNINFIGANPIASLEEDTSENWAKLGTGIAGYSTLGMITDQPSQYGILVNQVYGDTVFQKWCGTNVNGVWYRRGNRNGWQGTWIRVLDEKTGTQKKLLWSNASPGSSFAAQNPNGLDVTGYDEVEIECRTTTASSFYWTTTIKKGRSGQIIGWAQQGSDGVSTLLLSRQVVVSTSTVTFRDAEQKNIDTKAVTTSNSNLIPVKVWGIKGVQ